MMNKKQQISSDTLLALARALSAQYGVEVRVVSGVETASTSVETITLPSGKTRKKYVICIPELYKDSDGNYLPLTRLYIDHEVGHVRFTDWEVNPVNKCSKILHSLWNVFEDNRVEYLMGEYFPGCKINLAEGNKILYPKMVDSWSQRINILSHTDPADVLSFVSIYLIGQMLVYSGVDSLKCPLEEFVNNHVRVLNGGGRIDKLHGIAKEAVEYPGTTATSLTYAQRVLDIIAISDSPQPDDGQQEDKDDKQQNGGLFTEQQYDTAMIGDSVPSKSDWLAQQLDLYTSYTGVGNTVAQWKLKPPKQIGEAVIIDFDKCKIITEVLDGKLRSLLQSYKMNYGAAARCGRLAYNKLYRLSLNDSRVFERRVERRQLNTEVVVLCDASGSMRLERHAVVAPAVYALISSLRKLNGVTSHAYAFADDWVAPIITPDAPITRENFMYECDGGTPLGSAIYKVLQKFRTEDTIARKFFIIMTDGVASDVEYAKKGCALAAKMGVEVLGLNIQHTALRDILPPERVVDVDKLEDVPRALFQLLQKHWVGVE